MGNQMQAASGCERLKFVRWRFSNFTFMETLGAPKLILVVNEFSKYSSLWRMVLAPNNISCQHSITYINIYVNLKSMYFDTYKSLSLRIDVCKLKINEVGARCYKYTGCPTRVIFPGLRPGPWKSIIRDPNSIAWLK